MRYELEGVQRNLYHVQDSDRPMYVVATSWEDALKKWCIRACEENPDDDMSGVNPDGIAFIAEGDDLIM